MLFAVLMVCVLCAVLSCQVLTLQGERCQLLSALSSLEASLSAAQSAAEDQGSMRQRLEDAVQAKALAVMEANQVRHQGAQ